MVVVSNQRVRQLSNDLVVLSARLVREVRRNYLDVPITAGTPLQDKQDSPPG